MRAAFQSVTGSTLCYGLSTLHTLGVQGGMGWGEGFGL